MPKASSRLVVVVAYEGCQSLDITGPWEVFAKASKLRATGLPYRLVLASPHGGSVRTTSGLEWAGTTCLADIEGPVDTLLICGGDEGVFDPGGSAHSLVDWLRRNAHTARRLGSVCTGAFALAAAGLLDGRRATTHWSACALFARTYPEVLVEPDALYVADHPCYCSAGISAGIDLSLALVEADLGQPCALAVARELVLYLRRSGGQSQFSAGLQAQHSADARFQKLVAWMMEHPASDLGVRSLADRLALSERHFARLFRDETGQTPARFVEALRLDRAKNLPTQTAWPMAKIATRAGYGSVDGLQRSLRRDVGITPQQYRHRFA